MLLRTRFYIPPLKPEHLVRSKLIERLQQTRGGELVLISAPAGYGKTTLVSQWLHAHSQSFAWLIVDKSQAIVEVFWQHIIGALQTLIPNIGQQSLQYLHNKDVEKAVIALLNDLDRLDVAQESDHAYTLVMDDFHKADSIDNTISLNLFLDHLPPSLRVVMTVRQDPALAIARRRASGQLVEFQQQDLAFNSNECFEFLQQRLILQGQLQDTVSQDVALELTRATEGWITGIQLSAMSSLGLESRDLNRDMADYLFEEVFSQQPKPLQNFLLFTACVEKFCPALTNSLCDIDDSYHVIKELEAANLFIIALDNHRTWYRYHDLFRQFLLLHVQTLSQKQQRTLHLAAANWFEEGGYYELAFQHAVILKDWHKCLALFENIAEEKIELGLQHSLQDLLTALPSDIANSLSQKYSAATAKKASLEKQKSFGIESLIEPLTKRETQVMALVQQGLNNKEIAEKLFISLNTLKVHIRNLYGKMGVENRTQALLKMQG
ncbi:MAG: AAA family ATPase [Oleispira sp.]|nr:AAA family ATPase [Oleispira sp.]